MILRIGVLLNVSEIWAYLHAKKKYVADREELKVQKKWMSEERKVTEDGRGHRIKALVRGSLLPAHFSRAQRMDTNNENDEGLRMVSLNVFDDLTGVGVKGHLTKVRRQLLHQDNSGKCSKNRSKNSWTSLKSSHDFLVSQMCMTTTFFSGLNECRKWIDENSVWFHSSRRAMGQIGWSSRANCTWLNEGLKWWTGNLKNVIGLGFEVAEIMHH